MPRASSEIVIKRPREDVFVFLANPENDPQWRSGVLDLKRVSGSGIGARYTQGVKGPGGRRIPADIDITELTPGEAIAFRTIAGPVRPRGRYVLAAADGGTRVRFELDHPVTGGHLVVDSPLSGDLETVLERAGGPGTLRFLEQKNALGRNNSSIPPPPSVRTSGVVSLRDSAPSTSDGRILRADIVGDEDDPRD